jgi:hypothetical protein
MRIYTVQQGLDPRAAGDDLEFVREGFSWAAFAFTVFWPLYYGMWLVFVIVVILSLSLSFAMSVVGLSDFGRSAVWLAAMLLFAFEANNLRRWTLRRRGWRDVGVAAGTTLSDAEHRFFGVYAVSSSGTLIPRADASS